MQRTFINLERTLQMIAFHKSNVMYEVLIETLSGKLSEKFFVASYYNICGPKLEIHF